jgi:WD40 repeat protein
LRSFLAGGPLVYFFNFFDSFFDPQDNVSCLAAGPAGDGVFASGSWDKTVRVWRNNECTQVLRGHELAVWAVLILDNGDIVSAAADKTIKVHTIRRPYIRLAASYIYDQHVSTWDILKKQQSP